MPAVGVDHGLLIEGFGLSRYADLPANPHGGLMHSWGPLRDWPHNPHVDMILVLVPWAGTHLGPGRADFSCVEREIALIHAAGKGVYLYPHPAFPPAWTEIPVVAPAMGWIDHFDEHAHRLQLDWCELISRRFGRDERVRAIRMSNFEHGEAWVHGERLARLHQRAAAAGTDAITYASRFLRRIFEAFLRHADPHRLVAHGGGLQGAELSWAVAQGTGHGNGTHLLDFGGVNQYPRPSAFTDGHFTARSLAEEGNRGLYFAERQAGSAWRLPSADFKRWFLTNLASSIVHRTNYLVLTEVIYNAHDHRRLSPYLTTAGPLVSPDGTGRLIRRCEESPEQWRHEPEFLQMALWARGLLGASLAGAPEAFVQLGEHFVTGRGSWLRSLEYGLRLDYERSAMTPVEPFDLSVNTPFQRELLGERDGYFAKRTDHASGRDTFHLEASPEFLSPLLGLEGELLELRVTFRDHPRGRIRVVYPRRDNQAASLHFEHFQGTGAWRTARLLLTDPRLEPGQPFPFEIRNEGEGELTLCLVRLLRQRGDYYQT
jgi:hypothetical protein